MTDTLREKLRREVRRHRFMVTGCSDQPMCCSCQEGCCDEQGWMLTMTPDDHLDHIADAILAIPDIAVVELPEPDPVPTDEDDGKPPLARWGAESGADFQTSVWHFGEVQIDQYARGGWWEALEPISAANARRFAAALLAAAEKAEEK
jgi:hypothetical protein